MITGFSLPVMAQKYTVVIDAGHGGKDPGACDNDVREKDINLAVAKKVAEKLRKKRKDIKVILTRDQDKYLSLQQRADIANKNKADLFISIHTNSVDAKNPNRTKLEGASTYTLGLHKDNENKQVAQRENQVIKLDKDLNEDYSGFDPDDDESYIIFEMAQKANMANSQAFAKMVQRQLVNTGGRKNLGVKQAGFWVLWATAMPSVLIELDFITNPEKALALSNPQIQDKLATAIFSATDQYFKAVAEEAKKEQKKANELAKKNNKKNNQNNKKNNQNNKSKGKDTDKPVEVDKNNSVTLAAAKNVNRTHNTKTATNNKRQYSSREGERRRRNRHSRELSLNREYDVAVIDAEENYVLASGDVALVEDETQNAVVENTTSAQNNKTSNKKQDNKKSNKKEKNQKDNKKKNNNNNNSNVRTFYGKPVVITVSNQNNTSSNSNTQVVVNNKKSENKDKSSDNKKNKQDNNKKNDNNKTKANPSLASNNSKTNSNPNQKANDSKSYQRSSAIRLDKKQSNNSSSNVAQNEVKSETKSYSTSFVQIQEPEPEPEPATNELLSSTIETIEELPEEAVSEQLAEIEELYEPEVIEEPVKQKAEEQLLAVNNPTTMVSVAATSKATTQVSTKKSSPIRLDKRKQVYRIVIVSSDEELTANDPQFKGYRPDKCFQEDNHYIYTFGEYTNQEESNKLLKIIQESLPSAYVKQYTY